MKPTVSKLVPPMSSLAEGSGRSRQQYSATTKSALVEVATGLFTEQGYANTSLEAIVGGARVTKGALYHHFSGKQALFEAVFERVETASATTIRQAMTDTADPWQRAIVGLRSFLAVVQEATYRRIVIQDGPAVLGYERFREQEERTAYGVVEDIVRSVFVESGREVDEEMIVTFARLFCGALSSAGESVSEAPDPVAAASRVETAIGAILRGLRSVADEGDLPGSPTSR